MDFSLRFSSEAKYIRQAILSGFEFFFTEATWVPCVPRSISGLMLCMCVGQGEQLWGWQCKVFKPWWAGGSRVSADCRLRGWGSLRWAVLVTSFYLSTHPVLHNLNVFVVQPFSIYVVPLKIIIVRGLVRSLFQSSPSVAQGGLSATPPKLSGAKDNPNFFFFLAISYDWYFCKVLEILNYQKTEKNKDIQNTSKISLYYI